VYNTVREKSFGLADLCQVIVKIGNRLKILSYLLRITRIDDHAGLIDYINIIPIAEGCLDTGKVHHGRVMAGPVIFCEQGIEPLEHVLVKLLVHDSGSRIGLPQSSHDTLLGLYFQVLGFLIKIVLKGNVVINCH